MKNKVLNTRKCLMTGLMILLLMIFFTVPAAAGSSVVISGSKSVNKGDSFTVTVTFKGDDIGRVDGQMTYDSSVLSYVSGGSSKGDNGYIELADAGTGEELTFNLKFKASGEGTTSLKVTTQGVYNLEEEYIDAPSGAMQVSVNGNETESMTDETQGQDITDNQDVSIDDSSSDNGENGSLNLVIIGAVCTAALVIIVLLLIRHSRRRYRGKH
ncbi:MAG: cohesin domain-containing protein [Firmicutes bacterium]|nr:cohesin domain-containing protein [Bacillota bacterium]